MIADPNVRPGEGVRLVGQPRPFGRGVKALPARHGNVQAREGCDRCYCGCKYWQRDTCIDCGTTIAECLADPEWIAENRS